MEGYKLVASSYKVKRTMEIFFGMPPHTSFLTGFHP
jgi:hypothetical protein